MKTQCEFSPSLRVGVEQERLNGGSVQVDSADAIRFYFERYYGDSTLKATSLHKRSFAVLTCETRYVKRLHAIR